VSTQQACKTQLNHLKPFPQPHNTLNSQASSHQKNVIGNSQTISKTTQFCPKNCTILPLKQPQNDSRRHRHIFRAAAPPSPSYPAVTAAAVPRRCRCSFLIAVAAFGSSWIKKGDDGLGLGWWWWLRV